MPCRRLPRGGRHGRAEQAVALVQGVVQGACHLQCFGPGLFQVEDNGRQRLLEVHFQRLPRQTGPNVRNI